MFICKDCGREVRKDDVCCPNCGSTAVVINNYNEETFTLKSAFKNMLFRCVNFKGRSGRNEFWKAFGANIVAALIFCVLVAVVLVVVVYPTMQRFNANKPMNEMDIISFIFAGMCAVATVVYCIVLTLGWIALFVRRLHDTGKTGLLVLIGLVPVVGVIALLVLAVSKSQEGINKYGTDPNSRYAV